MTYLCVSIKTGSCLQKLEEIATEDTGVRNKLQGSYRVPTSSCRRRTGQACYIGARTLCHISVFKTLSRDLMGHSLLSNAISGLLVLLRRNYER